MSDKKLGFGKRPIVIMFETTGKASDKSVIELMYLEHNKRPPGMCAQWPFCKCGGLGVESWAKE
jgi:hypothetical protein